MDENQNLNECCPPFDPAPWDDKIIEWDSKLFIKDKVFTFFYMPVGFGRVMKRLDQKVRSASAKIIDNLCLSYQTSKWNMDVYLAIDKEIPNANIEKLNGKFYSRVYEGSFNDTGKWCNDFEVAAEGKGLKVKKWYMWYTTCPKCAKKFGKNYVVILGEV